VASADPVRVNYDTVDGIGGLGAVAGDTAGEGDESFSVVLSNAVKAMLDFNALK